MPVRPTAETMEVDAGSLEKALEEPPLKLAPRDPRDPPITNTIESCLNEQGDVVRRPESIASRSQTFSHISCAHHCSCRKEIALLQRENHAIKINQQKKVLLFDNEKNFSTSPLCPEGSTGRICKFHRPCSN